MSPMDKIDNLTETFALFGFHLVAGKGLKVEPKPLDDPMRWLDDLVTKHHPTGWAQFSAVNVRLQDGNADRELSGLLLAAELYVPKLDESHHLRHNGDHWIATKITLTDDPDAFIEARAFISTDGMPPLRYEVAWSGDPLRQTAFRLVSGKAEPNDEKKKAPLSNVGTSNF